MYLCIFDSLDIWWCCTCSVKPNSQIDSFSWLGQKSVLRISTSSVVTHAGGTIPSTLRTLLKASKLLLMHKQHEKIWLITNMCCWLSIFSLCQRTHLTCLCLNSCCEIPLRDPSQEPSACLIICMHGQNISVCDKQEWEDVCSHVWKLFSVTDLQAESPKLVLGNTGKGETWSANPNLASRGANARAST